MKASEKSRFKAIVIGGSAGSIKVVKNIVRKIEASPALPIIIGLHRLQSDKSSNLREVIQQATQLPVVEPVTGDPIRGGQIYLAPVNYHLEITSDYTFALSSSPLVHYSRPSIDMLFLSAAEVFQDQLVGILLTGANKDGAFGMKRIKDKEGLTIVQDPDECFVSTMPQAALALSPVDYVLTTDEIAGFINQLLAEQ